MKVLMISSLPTWVSENMQFCLETCTQMNIRDQITEGLLGGDTVGALLQENNLTFLGLAMS